MLSRGFSNALRRHASLRFGTRFFTSKSHHPPRLAPVVLTGALALGVSGACFLYSVRTLHADSGPPSSIALGFPAEGQSYASPYPAPRLDYLKQAAISYLLSDDPGIIRYDSIVVPSNAPSEDYITSAFVHLDPHTWSIFSIFDGHNGHLTSAWLSDNLIPAIVGGLADLFSKQPPIDQQESQHTSLGTDYNSQPTPPLPEEIDQAIKDAFNRVDDDIVNWAVQRALSSPSKAAAVNLLHTAQCGSCALVAFYESETKKLRVAVTGDSRAVLGRRKTDGNGKHTYEIHVLSVEHNAHNPAEQERMSRDHPGETIMANGRVLGWGISRAFGDAAYKWSLDIQERLNEEYLGDRIPKDVKTPPYFTAEPEITTTDVKPGDFLIMGSDGLWDCLTNEEAVGLVGLWKETHDMSMLKGVPSQTTKPAHHMVTSDFDIGDPNTPYKEVIARDDLPVTHPAEDKTIMYRWWRAEKKFVNVDDNVASHLARNALGGANRDLAAALLGMVPPRSRHYRDDLSALVVFFKEDLGHLAEL